MASDQRPGSTSVKDQDPVESVRESLVWTTYCGSVETRRRSTSFTGLPLPCSSTWPEMAPGAPEGGRTRRSGRVVATGLPLTILGPPVAPRVLVVVVVVLVVVELPVSCGFFARPAE